MLACKPQRVWPEFVMVPCWSSTVPETEWLPLPLLLELRST
jgi:hypothetical protein